MGLLFFLLKVFVISFSGVMQPGPVTATAIAIGRRSRYAGALLTIGHAIIEFPVMILIILGMDKLLKSTRTQIIIGLAGGVFLLIMAIDMLGKLKTGRGPGRKALQERPILAGLILSAGNPYFLLWWATVGLALASSARSLGVWAFALFAIVHWLCDCVWLQAVSWASFKGSALLGARSERVLLLVCALALLAFGLFFIYGAVTTLIEIT